MTVTVRFLRGKSPFQAGEVAGFVPATASELIERGIAVEVKPKAMEKRESKEVQFPPVDKMEKPTKPKRRTKKSTKKE
jgi:hypothetical protein